jgi:CRP-like cAMP-binding protein
MTPDRPGNPFENALIAASEPMEAARLLPHLRFTPFPQAHLFYEPGDDLDTVYFPVDGVISMLCVTREGAVETATVGREGGIGLTAGFGPRKAAHRAIAQTPGAAWCASAEAFRRVLADAPALRDQAARHTEAMLAQVMQSVACNTLHPVEARLARWILMCHDRTRGDVVPLTQAFLAQMLGVQRTTVSAAAQVLQAQGLIAYSRGRIGVKNREGLEASSCECYAASRLHYSRLLGQPEAEPPEAVEAMAV